MYRNIGLFLSFFSLGFAFIKLHTDIVILQCIFGTITGVFAWILLRGLLPVSLLDTLHDKTVLITGCDTGFGNKLAKRLDELGVTVYAGCLAATEAVDLKQTCSTKLHIVQLDVTKDDEVKEAVKYVKNTLGNKKLWAVVNNAGIINVCPMEWYNIQNVYQMMDVNFLGAVRVTMAFLPLLKEAKGRIVNISSIAGRFSCPMLLCYSCTKFALTAFSDGFRAEMKRFSVSLHCIQPWIYLTPIISTIKPEEAWNNTSQAVKETHTKNYVKDIVRRVRFFTLFANRDATPVVDSMVEACIGKSPENTYHPSVLDRFFFVIVQVLPGNILTTVVMFLFESRSPITQRIMSLFTSGKSN